MRIVMIGSGYVGLVSGACFADFGHQVTCIDNDAEQIAALEAGQMPIYEPGLHGSRRQQPRRRAAALLHRPRGRGEGRRSGVHRSRHAAAQRRRTGRPARRLRGRPAEVGRALGGFTVVVNKSTAPIGTGDEIERIIRAARPDADFAVVSNPEFLREGTAIYDFKHPDRIIIGGEDPRVAERDARSLPAALSQRGALPVHRAAHGGADQVRLQRLPRHQDRLHQRDGRHLREGGRQRAGSRARHGARQPHRLEVPARRARASAARAFPRTRGRSPTPRASSARRR